jgi:glutaredoxin
MKILKSILLILVITIILPFKVNAANNTVNMYLFYKDSCPHCAALEEILENEVKPKYSNLKVYRYEVEHSSKNRDLMYRASKSLNINVTGVPFAIIGTKTFIGYSETMTKSQIENTIKVYSKVASYKDPVGEELGIVSNTGDLTYDDIVKADKSNSDFIIDIPFVGPTETKTLSLPILSIIIGTIDGFNPCAMWVLLFLISVLIGMKDRKRMWLLGSAFMITSAIIYLVFMLTWLNLAIFIGAIWWVKMLIAIVALIGGYINLKTFIKTKDAGCEVVDENKRKKLFTRIKKFTSEKKFGIALLGVVALAISVNFIELTCSAGLPVIFTNILALNNLSIFEYCFYIFLYLLFFLLDDLIVFFIAMTSLKLKGISNKYAKFSHLIGGIIMVIIGLLMILSQNG